MKKSKTGAIALGVAFVWFTTHFGGGFASGAQIYSYFVRYGAWCILMPVLAMAYNGVFFAYSLRFARKHQTYDYRSYNNAFYGKYAPIFSNLFELLYLCVMCVAPAVAFATGGATLSQLTGLPYSCALSSLGYLSLWWPFSERIWCAGWLPCCPFASSLGCWSSTFPTLP